MGWCGNRSLGIGLVVVLGVAIPVADAISLVKWTWSWFGTAGLVVVGGIAALLGVCGVVRARRRKPASR